MTTGTLTQYQLLPELTADEYQALKADIAERGVLVPVEFDEAGAILDGHHRVRAWTELKAEGIVLADFPRIIRKFATEEEKQEHVLALNLERRHLSREQRAELVATLRGQGWSTRKIAEQLNVSVGTVHGDSQVFNSEQVIPPATVTGKDGKQYAATTKPKTSVAPQVSIFATSEAQQKEAEKAATAIDATEGVITTKNAQKQAAEKRREEIAASKADVPLPSSKYRVIYADPPWAYQNTMPEGTTQPDDHYKLMTVDEIAAMPVAALAQDDAVLFLWVTSPILEESFRVVRAWGFQYKASFVWDKVKHNMGHYNSVRHELLLICVRGSCQPEVKRLFDSVVSVERTGHSVKPLVFREMIDTIYPSGKRIELFARSRAEGWDVHGNDLS